MTREIITVEGVILKSLKFKEYDRILTLYTKNEGLIKLYVKLSKRSLSSRLSLLTPFTTAEFQVSKGNSDFFRFHDGSLLDQRLFLRGKLEYLQIATQFIELTCQTQWPDQASPPLYLLLNSFLSLIPKVEEPKKLLTLFYLKLLKHEGVLQISHFCSECNKKLVATFRFKGECYCEKDAPPPSIVFSPEEETLLQILLALRECQQLVTLPSTESFAEKIKELFEQSFRAPAYSRLS